LSAAVERTEPRIVGVHSLAEIESVLITHPDVADVAVSAYPTRSSPPQTTMAY
jgi:hypothetical protein